MIVFVIEHLSTIIEGNHREKHHTDKPMFPRHPVVGITRSQTSLPHLHLSDTMHDIKQLDILTTIILHTRIMVHQTCHQRTGRTDLDS